MLFLSNAFCVHTHTQSVESTFQFQQEILHIISQSIVIYFPSIRCNLEEFTVNEGTFFFYVTERLGHTKSQHKMFLLKCQKQVTQTSDSDYASN